MSKKSSRFSVGRRGLWAGLFLGILILVGGLWAVGRSDSGALALPLEFSVVALAMFVATQVWRWDAAHHDQGTSDASQHLKEPLEQ